MKIRYNKTMQLLSSINPAPLSWAYRSIRAFASVKSMKILSSFTPAAHAWAYRSIRAFAVVALFCCAAVLPSFAQVQNML